MSARKTIILVGCGKAKQTLPGWSGPAEDLYTGSLFRARRQFAKYCLYDTQSFYGWFIVSAKYTLLDRSKIVRAYDQKITDLKLNDRKQWALEICSILLSRKTSTPAGLEHLRPSKTTIALHMGADYCEHLRPVLDAVGYTTIWPVEGMSQGEQLAWYRDVLKAGGETLGS